MLLNLWIYIWFVFVTTVFCLAAFPFVLIARVFYDPQRWSSFIRRTMFAYGRVTLKVAMFPFIRIEFQDQAEGEREPGIFIVNHRSGIDAFLMATLRREACMAVNYWPLKLPFFGFFAKQGEYLDITGLEFEKLEEQALSLLRRNVDIIAFPEGTRSNSRQMNQFHSGIFRIAITAKCRIYPICIIGSEKVVNRSFRFSAGTITIRKLPCIKPEAYSDMTAFALKNYVHQIIAEECMNMDTQLQGTVETVEYDKIYL